MSEVLVYDRLEKILTTALGGVYPIAYPNVAFPSDGLSEKPETYLKLGLIPNGPQNRVLSTGREKYLGIFEVIVVTTARTGLAPFLEIAGQIAALYVKGNILFAEGVKIEIIRKPRITSLRQEDELWIPVTVEYQYFA